MDHHEDNDADAWAYRADAEYTFDNSDFMDKVRFGVRYEDYNSTTRETGVSLGIHQPELGRWSQKKRSSARRSVPFPHAELLPDWFHGWQRPGGVPVQPNTASSVITKSGPTRSRRCRRRRA